jgi:serine/threonine protein kinase/CHASE2 domain-containing sensor protein
MNAPVGSSPDVMRAYLDKTCGEDAELRVRVEGLLAANAEAETEFMGLAPLERQRKVLEIGLGSASTLADDAPVTEGEGDTIGNYKLLQKLGEGGFGVVYLADQLEPVKRRVALKVIKLGMDTRQVVARFEAERQALALMDHPNIAKVYDAGSTQTGRPFFVMELVKGVPITTFCDEGALGTRERLELFVDVCRAVQHAHQKGIIHRDLKPSNVMVSLHDDKAVVKVIDFGVAKATQMELTDKTLFTRMEQFIGTPAYMSPEQAQLGGPEIDTRSDIYALGVLLYELLTGCTPFDTRELLRAGYDEIRRVIRENDPPKPSTRLSTLGEGELSGLAKQRNANPKRLHAHVRGELDWIVMKALEKDRTRRYETANAFAADIMRHLSGEPVSAAAPSARYRIAKYVRRHRGAVLIGATILLLVIVGAVVSGLQWNRARVAEKELNEFEKRARKENEVPVDLAEPEWWRGSKLVKTIPAFLGTVAFTPVREDLVFLGIDEASMAPSNLLDQREIEESETLPLMMEPFPWDRRVWAEVIERLGEAGARLIIMDLLFTQPSKDPAADQALAEAIRQRRDKVILIGAWGSEGQRDGSNTTTMIEPMMEFLGPPEDETVYGYSNFWPGFDGVVRKAIFRMTLREAQMVEDLERHPDEQVFDSLAGAVGRKMGIEPPDGKVRIRYVVHSTEADDEIPWRVDSVFAPVSLYKIFSEDAWRKDFQDGAFFKDKVVLVGPAAPLFNDQVDTPLGMIYGGQLHLQVLNCLLDGTFVPVESEASAE